MLGQLASSLAHELNQPLGAILRNAEAAELFLQSDAPDLDELRAIVTDIRKDDQRAGGVIDEPRITGEDALIQHVAGVLGVKHVAAEYVGIRQRASTSSMITAG
jgi:signal transduction histidine kinase